MKATWRLKEVEREPDLCLLQLGREAGQITQ